MNNFNHIVGYILLAAVLLLPGQTPVSYSSDDSACPEIVRTAFDITQQACDGTGRNQACYGHILLNAELQANASTSGFEHEGDIANVADIRSLRISAMDLESRAWGIALMQLQASLPDAQVDQNITMLLFGDVQIENAMSHANLMTVTAEATTNVNIRQRPTLGALVVGQIAPGEAVTATGRLDDSAWIRIRQPRTGITGWVFGELLTSENNIDDLDPVDAAAQYYGPMQAFTFQSGADDAMCPEAPHSGILIQTPEGAAKVTLLINEIDIQLGSTVFFQAQPGESMTIQVIEGSARVTVSGETKTAFAGTQITVPLDQTLTPAGTPEDPAPYEMAHVAALPVELLERSVVVHPPLSEDEIDALLAPPVAPPPVVGDSTGDEGDEGDEGEGTADTTLPGTEPASEEDGGPPSNPGQDGSLPPGLVDNPGLGDSIPPGQNGSPPGQDKKE
jgi:hypothetical protein